MATLEASADAYDRLELERSAAHAARARRDDGSTSAPGLAVASMATMLVGRPRLRRYGGAVSRSASLSARARSCAHCRGTFSRSARKKRRALRAKFTMSSGPTLTALRMDLDWMAERLPAEMQPLREKRSAMVKLVEAAVAATRKIVTDLRPSILDDLGLAAAVRWQASEFQKHTGIPIEVKAPDADGKIERDTALALFRIFRRRSPTWHGTPRQPASGSI